MNALALRRGLQSPNLPKLAGAVGANGRVFAVDVGDEALKNLRAKVEKEKLANVTAIQAAPDDPRLLAGELDAALVVNSYHEMKEHSRMLSGLLAALRPGGRLVVVDMMPRKTRRRPREIQVRNHVLSPDLAESELRQAGFEIVSRADDFLDSDLQEEVRWMIVARRRDPRRP